jgi:hypothetical protein
MAVTQKKSRPKTVKGKKNKGKLSGVKTEKKKAAKNAKAAGKTAAAKKAKTEKPKKTGKKINARAGSDKKTGRQKPVTGVKKTASKGTAKPKKKKTADKMAGAAKKRPVKKRETGVKAPKSAVKPPFSAYSGAKPYIFVSYAHKDMKAVFAIIDKLNTSGYRFWYDEGLEPGEEWPEIVGKRIIKCGQFLMFMSPFAVKSRNVRNEINLAFSENKNILVIYLDSTRLSSGLKLQLGSVHFVNKYDLKNDEFFKKLRSALKK